MTPPVQYKLLGRDVYVYLNPLRFTFVLQNI